MYKFEEDHHSKAKISQSLEEIEKIIISLKIQLEEAKRKEKVVRIQLKENDEICDKLESEIILLRKELEKSTAQLNRSLKFGKGAILDDIINFQNSPNIKIGLGYDNSQKDPKENDVK